MAKDRNTMAKRQREADKKRKQLAKRERKSQKKGFGPEPESNPADDLSAGEVKVLNIFRRYLMGPGQMLCLNGNDLETMGDSLEQLIASGMLLPEGSKGGYALTRKGFEVMGQLPLE